MSEAREADIIVGVQRKIVLSGAIEFARYFVGHLQPASA